MQFGRLPHLHNQVQEPAPPAPLVAVPYITLQRDALVFLVATTALEGVVLLLLPLPPPPPPHVPTPIQARALTVPLAQRLLHNGMLVRPHPSRLEPVFLAIPRYLAATTTT